MTPMVSFEHETCAKHEKIAPSHAEKLMTLKVCQRQLTDFVRCELIDIGREFHAKTIVFHFRRGSY